MLTLGCTFGRHDLIAELRRQAEAGSQGLRVDAKPKPAEMMTIQGRVNLDKLSMTIVGSLAGGP